MEEKAKIDVWLERFTGIATIGVFCFVIFQNAGVLKSVDAAVRSANTSEAQFAQSKIDAEDAAKESRKKFVFDSIVTAKRFRQDSTSTAQQIVALKKHVLLLKEQFEIENRPMLNITPQSMTASEKGIRIVYSLSNIGKYPTKTISAETVYLCNPDSVNQIVGDMQKIFKIKESKKPIGVYVGEQPTNIITQVDAEPCIGYLYLGFRIVFEDLVSHKRYRLFYVGKVLTVTPLNWEIIYFNNSIVQ